MPRDIQTTSINNVSTQTKNFSPPDGNELGIFGFKQNEKEKVKHLQFINRLAKVQQRQLARSFALIV